MKTVKYKKLILILFILFIFTGCWDKTELQNRGFIIVMGVDKCKNLKKEYNKSNKKYFKVTMIEPSSKFLKGESEGKTCKYIKVGKSENLSSAMSNISSYSSKKNYFGHTKLVVLGKDILNDEEMLKEVLDTLSRNREISKKILILSTPETANFLISKNIENEPMIGMFVSKFYKNNNNLGITFKKDLDNLIKDIRVTSNAVIPKINISEENIKLGGLAILRNFKLLGWLNDIETRGYMWVKGNIKDSRVVGYLNNIPLSLVIEKNKSKITFNEDFEKLKVNIDVDVLGSIESYTLTDDILFEESKIKTLSCIYEKVIRDEIETTFDILKNEFAVDSFNLLDTLKKKNYKLYLICKDNWNEIYNNLEYNINVSVKIRNIGDIK